MTERIGPPDNFHVELRTDGSTTVLVLRGEQDMANAPILEDQLSRLGDPDAILVDLHGLTFMDARGLHVLLDAQRDAQRQGERFGVINVRPPVAVLAETGGG